MLQVKSASLINVYNLTLHVNIQSVHVIPCADTGGVSGARVQLRGAGGDVDSWQLRAPPSPSPGPLQLPAPRQHAGTPLLLVQHGHQLATAAPGQLGALQLLGVQLAAAAGPLHGPAPGQLGVLQLLGVQVAGQAEVQGASPLQGLELVQLLADHGVQTRAQAPLLPHLHHHNSAQSGGGILHFNANAA